MEGLQVHLLLFYIFSFLLITSALGVVINRNPVKSALFLVVFFVSLSAMFALLGAQFMATLQVLVYVGAIMVLFLFVIMLIAVRDVNFTNIKVSWVKYVVLLLVVGAFSLQFIVMAGLLKAGSSKININTPYVHTERAIQADTIHTIKGNTEVISFKLFKHHLLPFEIISIVLLVAVIGAVMLAKKDRRQIE